MGWTTVWPGGAGLKILDSGIQNGSLAHASEPHAISMSQMWASSERPQWGYLIDNVEGEAFDSTTDGALDAWIWIPPFASYVALHVYAKWDKSSGGSFVQFDEANSGDQVAVANLTDTYKWYALQAVDTSHPTAQPRAILGRDTSTYPLDQWAKAEISMTLSNVLVQRALWHVVPPGGRYVVP